jgi:HlyD family secretion protein
MKAVKNLLRLLGGILFLGVVLVLGGMFNAPSVVPGVATAPEGADQPTKTAEAVIAARPVWYKAVGTISSRTRVDVTARATGQITELSSEVGQTVKKGERLATLTARELEARVEQARSALIVARATAEQARAAFDRVSRLAERGAATAEELERVSADKVTAEASVAAAAERVKEAEVALDYLYIESPIDGVVAARPVDPGDIAWPGKPLYTIHDPSSLRIEAHVREGRIDRVVVGETYTITIASLGLTVEGTVEEIVPLVDPSSRSFTVRVALPADERLHPGMFGRLRLDLEEREAVLVPAAAVRIVGQLHTVLVRHHDRWVRRYVTIGEIQGDAREILSGLKGGETIGWNE